jgi:hypothetical protein
MDMVGVSHTAPPFNPYIEPGGCPEHRRTGWRIPGKEEKGVGVSVAEAVQPPPLEVSLAEAWPVKGW